MSFLSRFRLATFLCAGLAACLPAAAQLASRAGPVVTTPHVRAELVAHAPDGVSPGAPVWVGLQIAHQPGWHTYWKNAGDSGLPTELAWSLPAGVTSGDIAWPVPRKIPIGNLANYGYEHTVLLPVPLAVAPDFKPPVALTGAPELEVRLKASWLVCSKECIPEEGEFHLKLPLQGSTALHKSDFDAAFAAQPAPLAQPGRITVEGDRLQVRLEGLPAAAQGKSLEFFPETTEVIHTAAVQGKDWTQAWQGDAWIASVPLAAQRSASPAVMPVVVALAEADRQAGLPIAWRAAAPVSGPWPATAAPAQVSPALKAALEANANAPTPLPQSSAGFIAALLGALIGGLLLNLMPCVFPVLAIKVLGFTRHADDRGAHRRAALAYTGGVILSFLALGGAMLALRAAGAQLGWGFQLQSPAVVAALAALFTLIGLNLAGLFEFGRMAPASIGAVQARHPLANDFLSGVLAVVVASPCTAPFMGASLGFAIGLPASQALLLFAVLGFGLALPYLAAGFVPAVARLLPRPGAWMNTLRRLLAFPMFATVAWLVWVLGQQSGIDGAGALLGLLVGLAAIVWSLTLRGRTRWVLASLTVALTAVLAGAIGGHVVRPAEPVAAAAAGQRWQPWTAERANELVAAGQPVFVDFTAAWCVTCQYNKRSTLADPEVMADFDARKVALLRADWTRRDPAITAALTALGRSGVPVYMLQAPGKPPVVLTEILGKNELREALARL
ncbi:protein-disulfide reductase DsbD family protein [Variovorax saccharolyticus]|uniref:protein-disulfide reductase DsbD family protein n=1 Tax=Variovorax saccharolyticus TaxID=3053516 RepID=UPI002574C886|nr:MULTISPECIES: thioredoxin family protein [unclassified Variovorax]MDM0019629.1 protein-disulfide reductase DsbD family protein [Variovorax sp. J22R187]MDM0027781.1 protein-disulfide reductase DsbD family protein [Variovorax sp. J31P216]